MIKTLSDEEAATPLFRCAKENAISGRIARARQTQIPSVSPSRPGLCRPRSLPMRLIRPFPILQQLSIATAFAAASHVHAGGSGIFEYERDAVDWIAGARCHEAYTFD